MKANDFCFINEGVDFLMVSVICETVTTKQDQLLEKRKNDKFADDFHFTDLINSLNHFVDASDEISKLNQQYMYNFYTFWIFTSISHHYVHAKTKRHL